MEFKKLRWITLQVSTESLRQSMVPPRRLDMTVDFRFVTHVYMCIYLLSPNTTQSSEEEEVENLMRVKSRNGI
jgi:hypothetical protein